jgi:hypothetical protein
VALITVVRLVPLALPSSKARHNHRSNRVKVERREVARDSSKVLKEQEVSLLSRCTQLLKDKCMAPTLLSGVASEARSVCKLHVLG